MSTFDYVDTILAAARGQFKMGCLDAYCQHLFARAARSADRNRDIPLAGPAKRSMGGASKPGSQDARAELLALGIRARRAHERELQAWFEAMLCSMLAAAVLGSVVGWLLK
ncbi:hypothetical protein DBR47_24140 [Paucibacter sp. KBW04]|nr:hypothetical protein DBR47_24140 [Paucibacter sp. KBW04]